MKHSTPPPSAKESARMADMMRLGCVACASLNLWAPAEECHHIVEGNRRLGHWYTIPLCRGHHRGYWSNAQRNVLRALECVSIADGSKAFTRVYPTEKELWQRVQARLKLPAEWPSSKIMPRTA